MAFYDALVRGEHEGVIRDPERRKKILGDFGWKAMADVAELGAQVEVGRPFLGERLWHLFFVYRFVLIRSRIIALNAIDGMPFVVWYDDPGIREVLDAILSRDEQGEIFGDRLPFITCVDVLERKILEESVGAISGRRASEEALDHEREVARRLRSASQMSGTP